MNGSYDPELTDLLKEITEDIAKNIIKEGSPIILIDEYSWYREVLSLMAKQVNLCDSCMLLLENGMEQEAYLLARSQFNNTLWIRYLCEAEENDDTRLKEYCYQSDVNQLKENNNLKTMIKKYGDTLDEKYKDPNIINKLNRSNRKIKKELKREGIAEKTKNIADLAKNDSILFSAYVTLYNEGSKFEHSNISTIKRYRKKAIREYSQDQIFVFDLGKSNVNIWFTVFKYSLISMYWAFESISNRIQGREKQLLEEKPYGKSAYSEKDFTEIDMKFKKCMALVEREPKYQVVMKFKNENSDSNDVSEIQSKESKAPGGQVPLTKCEQKFE